MAVQPQTAVQDYRHSTFHLPLVQVPIQSKRHRAFSSGFTISKELNEIAAFTFRFPPDINWS